MSKVYNVSVPVVALVSANSPEEAIDKLRARIAAKGLIAQDDYTKADAFESEPGVEADF